MLHLNQVVFTQMLSVEIVVGFFGAIYLFFFCVHCLLYFIYVQGYLFSRVYCLIFVCCVVLMCFIDVSLFFFSVNIVFKSFKL